LNLEGARGLHCRKKDLWKTLIRGRSKTKRQTRKKLKLPVREAGVIIKKKGGVKVGVLQEEDGFSAEQGVLGKGRVKNETYHRVRAGIEEEEFRKV